jgi:hypothetical protein
VPVLTEAWIYEDLPRAKIERYIKSISAYVHDNGITFPSNTFIVLELRQSGRCGYYFVNHDEQCLFWLDRFDFSPFLFPLEISHTTSHVGKQHSNFQCPDATDLLVVIALLLQSHYW